MDVRLLFFTYPAEKIVARVDRSKAEMLSADTLLRNWRILTSWSGRGVVIISDTDNFSDINDNREFEIGVYREPLTAVCGYPFAVRRSSIIRFRLAVD